MSKKTTQMLKGIAILTMIFHHFCSTSLFEDLSVGWIKIGETFKICVGLYAVLSGYGYWFAKEKTIRYGLKKIWGLLQIYWLMLFTLFVPAAIMGGWKISFSSLFIQLFALRPNLNWFGWYVFFFIFCMAVMPLVHKMLHFKPIVNVVLGVAVPYLVEVVVHVLLNRMGGNLLQDLFDCLIYFYVFLAGYFMARYSLIERLNKVMPTNPILSIAGVCLVFTARRFVQINTFGFNMDVIYAPLAIYFLSTAMSGVGTKMNVFSVVLMTLGKYSTGMWFFHAVFFSTYIVDIFRPILMIVTQPVLMFAWLVLLSLAGAIFYYYLLEGLHFCWRSMKGRE